MDKNNLLWVFIILLILLLFTFIKINSDQIQKIKLLEKSIEQKKNKISKIEYYKNIYKKDIIIENMFFCADVFKIDPEILIALADRESRLNPNAIHYNSNGSIDHGVFQLNSNTFHNLSKKELFNIEKNIFLGSEYLSKCLSWTNNNMVLALCAYNCGIGNVRNNSVPQKTLKYVNDILETSNNLKYKYLEYLNK